MEEHIRKVVTAESIVVPLYENGAVNLDSRPGIPVEQAVRQTNSFSTVIRPFFLVRTHEGWSLSSVLIEAMRKRHEMRLPGAVPNVDYNGVHQTLRACMAQTGQFPWESFLSRVEHRFSQSHQSLNVPGSPPRILSSSMLLAAMDFLYLVQSLPEERVVLVDNQMGMLPLIVWAHFILGLDVLVEGYPGGNVNFGSSDESQVIIRWKDELKIIRRNYHSDEPFSLPRIFLFDSKDKVVLKEVKPEDADTRLDGLERHRLAGYGTTLLYRGLNEDAIVPLEDPVFTDLAHIITAASIEAGKAMRRVPSHLSCIEAQDFYPSLHPVTTPLWRIMETSMLLFSGIDMDVAVIKSFSQKSVWQSENRLIWTERMQSLFSDDDLKDESFIRIRVEQLVPLIHIFSHIVNISECKDAPFVLEQGYRRRSVWYGKVPIQIGSEYVFKSLARLLLGETCTKHLTNAETIFLISEYGWSLYLPAIGDLDPEQADCELFHLTRGVPTNRKTGERKNAICDAPLVLDTALSCPMVVDASSQYVPRCVSPVTQRTEYYSAMDDTFLLSVRYDIDESGIKQRCSERALFSEYCGPRHLYNALWNVEKTEGCNHAAAAATLADGKLRPNSPLPLSPDVVTAKGFQWHDDHYLLHYRICVCLVKGDPRARWLALSGTIGDFPYGLRPAGSRLTRRILLRTEQCCDECAVQQASAQEGGWLVVL